MVGLVPKLPSELDVIVPQTGADEYERAHTGYYGGASYGRQVTGRHASVRWSKRAGENKRDHAT